MTKTLYNTVFILFFVFIAPCSHASTLTKESQALMQQLESQIKSTMLAVARNEENAGRAPESLNFSLELPAQKITHLGLVLDFGEPQLGFSVQYVSPDSNAEALGLKVGDRLIKINDLKISQENARHAAEVLQNFTAGESIRLTVRSNNKATELGGQLKGQFVPSIKLDIGNQMANSNRETIIQESREALVDQKVKDGQLALTCGQVSVFYRPPETRDMYSAYISKINGKSVLRSKETFRLPIGKHLIEVHELIEDSFLKKRRVLANAKTIEIEVKADTTYYIAAFFIRDKQTKVHSGEYWQPIVWRTSERDCKL